MKQFAMAQWQRGRRSLASARQLTETDPDSAASPARASNPADLKLYGVHRFPIVKGKVSHRNRHRNR